jgi:hypothetical protein
MKQSPIVGLFGRRGTGKTTLARKIARHQARLLVWDYIGEHGPLAYRVESGSPEDLRPYMEWAIGQEFAAVRYVPQTGELAEFEAFCAIAYQSRNFVVLVEEVAAVCQASYLPPQFGRLIRQGRHRALGLLWTTQRLNEVSRTLTALTDIFAGFATSEPSDLLALGARAGRDYAEQIARLPRYSWLGYDVDSQATFTDEARLLALWGAPAKWNFPGTTAKTAAGTGTAGTRT